MPIKKKGLGKGLDSLIPDNKSMKSVTSEKTVESKEDAAAKSGVQVMKINEVEPNRDQPRKITMRSLRAKEDGELQNLPE